MYPCDDMGCNMYLGEKDCSLYLYLLNIHIIPRILSCAEFLVPHQGCMSRPGPRSNKRKEIIHHWEQYPWVQLQK